VDLGLKGRIAIVSASSRGIGKAVALALAQEGAYIALCARHQKQLEDTADEIRKATSTKVISVVADLTQQDAIRDFVNQTVKEFGKIDILVHNTGGPRPGLFIEQPDENWYHAFDLVFMSAVRLCREVIPWLKKSGGGKIIFMSSRTGKQPMENLILSNAIRSAIAGLSKSLSNEMASDRILVNVVSPGAVWTQRAEEVSKAEATRDGKSLEEVVSSIGEIVPLARWAETWEIGSLISFLASKHSDYITGSVIQIDGGSVKTIF